MYESQRERHGERMICTRYHDGRIYVYGHGHGGGGGGHGGFGGAEDCTTTILNIEGFRLVIQT